MTPSAWEKIDRVFQEASELEGLERSAFLDDACRGQPALREHVESLLQASAEADSFLERPPGRLAADLLAARADELKAGAQLGPYVLVSAIGKGGMGQVWKARDTRLEREVALKVCGAEFSALFGREARAIAAFNHPNICTIHDVGPNFLVMELIDGTPLAAEIKRGALPLERAVGFACQILDALAAAHRKGFTHRDLKPANAMVTQGGVIKLLDFGLATQEVRKSGAEAESSGASPAKAGAITGTPQYMSPEQLQGKEADARSDIFAFGCVLYEMLSGRKAFAGPTAATVAAAILEQEPEPLAAAAALDRVVRTCLSKNPDDRFQTARDVKRALLWAMEGTTAGAPERRRTRWIAPAAMTAVAVAAGLAAWLATRPGEPQRLVRLDVGLGTTNPDGIEGGVHAILSPDGSRIAFVSGGKLFTRRLDQTEAIEVAEQASSPFFSPDGKWVAFFRPGQLKKVSVEGGAAVALCAAPGGRGGSWGEDGNIIAALSPGGGLSRIPSAGGAPTPVTELAGEATHRWPQILPGGKAVLFTSGASVTGMDGASVEVVSLPDRRRKTLQRGGTFGRYLPGPNGTGHLVYLSKGVLQAAPFDPGRLELLGTPAPVLEDVAYNAADGSAEFDYSSTGTLIYRRGGAAGAVPVTIQWLDSAGQTRPLLAKPGLYMRQRLSPDGQRLALDDSADIRVYDIQREAMTQLTFSGGNISPIWSPDGRFLVYSGFDGGIWWVRSDGAGKPQPLIKGPNRMVPWSWSMDGGRVAYMEVNPRTAYDLGTASIEIDNGGLKAGRPEIFLQTAVDERYPAFSPDGRWLAYVSNESGTNQVFVRAFIDTNRTDKGGKWLISNTPSLQPQWSPAGRELFFRRASDNRILAAAYSVAGGTFTPGKERVWAEAQIALWYHPAPDGKRVAALMREEKTGQKRENRVTFLLHFGDELQRKAPLEK